MEFKIGEKVKHTDGRIGSVVDCMSSGKTGKTYYKILFEGNIKAGSVLYKEEELSSYDEKAQYTYEFEVLDNLVVARLYEVKGGQKIEVMKGHGHIFHDGIYGIAQAASYACKRICEDMNGGMLKSYKNDEIGGKRK